MCLMVIITYATSAVSSSTRELHVIKMRLVITNSCSLVCDFIVSIIERTAADFALLSLFSCFNKCAFVNLFLPVTYLGTNVRVL